MAEKMPSKAELELYPLTDAVTTLITDALVLARSAERLTSGERGWMTTSEKASVRETAQQLYSKLDEAGTAANDLWGKVQEL